MCEHYDFELQKGERYYIKAPDNNNCLFCVIEENPDGMTQGQIAEYLGISKMRVCQIEHRAISKLDKRSKKILHL